MPNAFPNPALIVAISMAAGVLATAVARHLRIPAIVLLLAVGVLLGPDVAGLVRPADLGTALHAVVGFAVAVILFEGGLNLDIKRLRREAVVIRRLVTAGAFVTAAGGAVAAHLLMGWGWRAAALFGSLIIVTGPTVITPVLRRIKVVAPVETVLEAEGIFIDAVGALIAVAVLDVALSPTGESVLGGLLAFAGRFAVGSAVGAVGGILLVLLLKPRRLIPAGLENILALSMAVAIYQVSSLILTESGIPAVIVAGMIVGNLRTRVHASLTEFKEQLTVLLIAVLFVLLAADVRVADVEALGTAGLATVLVVMLVVRPVNVFLATWGSSLRTRERLFLSWLAPRGIVAAAMASLFVDSLYRAEIPGGIEVRALVFLVIAMTVLVQALLAGPVASLLGVRRATNVGYVFLGANDLARTLARALRDAGEEVVLVDANPDTCHDAEEAGYKVVHGNGLEDRALRRAHADVRKACVGLTSNEQTNFLFARKIVDDFHGPAVYVALETDLTGVTQHMVKDMDTHVLFAGSHDLDLWEHRIRRGTARVERWRLEETPPDNGVALRPTPPHVLVPLVVHRNGKIELVSDRTRLREGDVMEFLVEEGRRDQATPWLTEGGWRPAEA